MSAAAGSALGAKGGVSKARPPAISATRDWVRTSTPPAPTETSIPLAFQKRVPGVDVLVVGRVDEDLDVDRLAIAGQVVRDDLAGLQAAEVDRRADPQRAEAVGPEHELAAGLVAGDDRGRLQPDEPALFLGRPADLEADELPESSVPSPETPLRVMRGSTTQNLASSTIRSAASCPSSPSPPPGCGRRRAAPPSPGRCSRPCT